MTQLQCMHACLDTLSTKLYQVNICVGHIAQRQAVMGGFAPETSPPPPLVAFEDEDEDDVDDATSSKDDDDRDASSSGIDEIST